MRPCQWARTLIYEHGLKRCLYLATLPFRATKNSPDYQAKEPFCDNTWWWWLCHWIKWISTTAELVFNYFPRHVYCVVRNCLCTFNRFNVVEKSAMALNPPFQKEIKLQPPNVLAQLFCKENGMSGKTYKYLDESKNVGVSS